MSDAAIRQRAARELAEILDDRIFKALCEPARIGIVRLLIARGCCDLGALAAEMPQDASVVSRHLALLHEAGVVRREKRGRHVFFELDGPAVVERIEGILARFRRVVPLCCPQPKEKRT